MLERKLARGAQMLGIAPPASAGFVLIIRKRRRADSSLEEFVRAGALSRAMATFVEGCLGARANILVCGSTAAGTAGFLSALAGANSGADRVVVLQDLDDIGVGAGHVVTLNLIDSRQRGEEAIHAAARIRADRVVVCSLAGSLVSATIDVIAGGAEGVIAAAQAPSLRQALARLVNQLVNVRPGSTWTRPASRRRSVRHRDRARATGRRSTAGGTARGARGERRERGRRPRHLHFRPRRQGDGTFGVSGVVPRVVAEFARGASRWTPTSSSAPAVSASAVTPRRRPPRVAASCGVPGASSADRGGRSSRRPGKVVVLVLDRDREEAFGVERERPTVLLLRPNGDPRRALDSSLTPGKLRHSSAPDDGLVPLEDLRVDEHAQVARLALGGDVDDEQLVGRPRFASPPGRPPVPRTWSPPCR